MKQQHIFLTGFMGSGKSTLGKKLSALLSMNFIDLDHYIEQYEKKTISFIFEHEGEAVFREMESRSLAEIINNAEPSVIALGGGTICFGENLQLVKKSGLLIYLELSAVLLSERLKNSLQKRPLLKKLTDDELIKTIREKLVLREPFYRQAHLIVNAQKCTAQTLRQQILEFKKTHNTP